MPRNLRPSELERRAGWIAAAGENLSRDIGEVLKRLRDWSVGTGGTPGPSPKNQVSRPTESAALHLDEFGRAREEIIAHIVAADQALREVERIRRWVMTSPQASDPGERGLLKCCNPRGCPDDSWASKAGRCDACYQYRWRTDRDRGDNDNARV